MSDERQSPDPPEPADRAIVFLSSLLMGMVTLAALGLMWWSPADQGLTVGAVFVASVCASAWWARRG